MKGTISMYNPNNSGIERRIYSELYNPDPDPDVVLAEQLGTITWASYYQEAEPAPVLEPRVVHLPQAALFIGEL
jgi:hypothetical protein